MSLKNLIIFAIALFSLQAFAGPMIEISSTEELNTFIKKSEYNGVILVAKDNRVLMKNAYGYKNLETKELLSISDKFQIGSNTKQFVAASILKLQEEGKLSLSDSLTKYLPELKAYSDIKIKDILNHTSGITNFTDHNEFWNMADYNKTLSLDDIINFTYQYPLDFNTRSNWNYSNSGYIIAGKIIEIVSGKSWDEYIKENFLIPLQMNNTGYAEYFNTVSDVDGHMMSQGQLQPFNELNLSWALSAGALYSTVDDLLKWTSIYDSSEILSDDSKTEMQTPFLNSYGLGVYVAPYGDDILVNHDGRTPGFVSSITYLKKSNLKVIALDNIDGAVKGTTLMALDFFQRGKLTVPKLDKITVDLEKLKEYQGTYNVGSFEFTTYIKDGKLFLKTKDKQPPYELIPNDLDSFNLGNFAGEEFVRDESGKITGVKHYQHEDITVLTKK